MEGSSAVAFSALFYGGESSRRQRRRLLDRNVGQWNHIDRDIAEGIFAQLPMVDILSCQSVCRGWEAVLHSPTFKDTAAGLFNRRAWFYMYNEQSAYDFIYDMELENWGEVGLVLPRDNNGEPMMPFTSSEGLICFKSESGDLLVKNPCNGSTRLIIRPSGVENVETIAFRARESSFDIFIIHQKSAQLFLKRFSSKHNAWNEILLTETTLDVNGDEEEDYSGFLEYGWEGAERGVTTVDGSTGEVMVYYLVEHGKLAECGTTQGTLVVYPPIIPDQDEQYVLNLVECAGRILGVFFMKSLMGFTTFCVCEFNLATKSWEPIAFMPEAMVEEYEDDVEIFSAGYGNCIIMCVSSESEEEDIYNVVMYDLSRDVWEELPECYDPVTGVAKKFSEAYAVMPDIQAKV